MRTLALLATLACQGKSPRDSEPATGNPTGGTTAGGTPGGTITGTGELEATCTIQPDNPLRFDCAVTTPTPGPVTLAWTGGGATRSATSTETLTAHAVTVWGMKPETTYTLEVTGPGGSATGTLTSGALPADLAAPVGTVSGDLTLDQFLVELPCGDLDTVAMLDGDGEIVWYQQYPDPGWTGLGIPYQGFQFTPRGTVLLSLGMNHLWEHDLGGRELRHWTRGVDWPDLPIHHDVFMADDGRIYALFGEVQTPNTTPMVVDGFFVWDDAGLIGESHLVDVFPVTDAWAAGPGVFWQHEYPGVNEYMHANSIAVLPDRTVLISLKLQESLVQVEGDPADPAFGALEWTLAGWPAGHPYDGDFTITSTNGATTGLDFRANHHASWFPGGKVGLFDNRGSGLGTSRGLVMAMDPVGGTADIEEVYEVGLDCPAQGSIYPLANGNRLVTCGPLQRVMEFEPGAATPRFELDITCAGALMVPRAIPVE